MLNLLVTLLVLVVIFGLLYWVIGMLPIPQPIKNIALAIVGVVLVIYLIAMLTGATTWPALLR